MTNKASSLHFSDPMVARIAEFLVSIGLRVAAVNSLENTFLPGVAIQDGVLAIDEARLLYPGDLLHEAGHLAMLPTNQRAVSDGNVGNDGGHEMGAMAWSYAAAIHLGIWPDIVFHDAGYHGEARALVENFAAGRYLGVPILEWLGLTATGDKAKALGIDAYPKMLRWLREE
jgi:hypothetical protein